ncbi:uncharacterized protein LOC104421384 [Eucalyptus grandis]|uniref:Uncharacterized protein n=2 Tax=Eucalyptus grandis TaxID=71139 RepID=A0ACC3J3D4_EUCGR|nr:uncharacterized protein LOC104421384 [Eucalyptus grandis]KAK3408339.1 hypothetical protein EUGRSUZ_J00600 [Eucalyptus grandis]
MPCLNSSMAFSLSSAPSFPCSTPCANPGRLICSSLVVRCEADGSSAAAARSKLEVGSPVIMTEAPTMIKTAASVPCLRINSGLVKPGDVGRIVSRKPKDVWAVRLAIGTYLIDGKYFEPLKLND